MRVCEVVAGWGHSAVVTRDGDLWVCGRNFKGQLGLGDPRAFPTNERGHHFQSEFVKVEKLDGKKVIQVACGGEHTVALLDDGDCYTFGSNSSGQLGHSTSEQEFFPTLVHDLKHCRRQVHQVACGNNCTIILAGRPSAPSLFTLCLERIQTVPELFEFVSEQQEMSGIPVYILDQILEQ